MKSRLKQVISFHGIQTTYYATGILGRGRITTDVKKATNYRFSPFKYVALRNLQNKHSLARDNAQLNNVVMLSGKIDTLFGGAIKK